MYLRKVQNLEAGKCLMCSMKSKRASVARVEGVMEIRSKGPVEFLGPI